MAVCAYAEMGSSLAYFLDNFKLFSEHNEEGEWFIRGAAIGFRPEESRFSVNLQIQQLNCIEEYADNPLLCLQLFGTELVYYPTDNLSIGLGYENRNRNKDFIEDDRLQFRLKVGF